jgi:hypothetical protein
MGRKEGRKEGRRIAQKCVQLLLSKVCKTAQRLFYVLAIKHLDYVSMDVC